MALNKVAKEYKLDEFVRMLKKMEVDKDYFESVDLAKEILQTDISKYETVKNKNDVDILEYKHVTKNGVISIYRLDYEFISPTAVFHGYSHKGIELKDVQVDSIKGAYTEEYYETLKRLKRMTLEAYKNKKGRVGRKRKETEVTE